VGGVQVFRGGGHQSAKDFVFWEVKFLKAFARQMAPEGSADFTSGKCAMLDPNQPPNEEWHSYSGDPAPQCMRVNGVLDADAWPQCNIPCPSHTTPTTSPSSTTTEANVFLIVACVGLAAVAVVLVVGAALWICQRHQESDYEEETEDEDSSDS